MMRQGRFADGWVIVEPSAYTVILRRPREGVCGLAHKMGLAACGSCEIKSICTKPGIKLIKVKSVPVALFLAGNRSGGSRFVVIK
jgi:hypothetical protein